MQNRHEPQTYDSSFLLAAGSSMLVVSFFIAYAYSKEIKDFALNTTARLKATLDRLSKSNDKKPKPATPPTPAAAAALQDKLHRVSTLPAPVSPKSVPYTVITAMPVETEMTAEISSDVFAAATVPVPERAASPNIEDLEILTDAEVESAKTASMANRR